MSDKKTFYITTPIYFPSANVHIGHAYTTIAADSINRYKKMRGYETHFTTGSDEHGQKIQGLAIEAGKQPLDFVSDIVENFKKVWQALKIDYDDFIRTTEPRHKEVAQKFFQKIYDNGDIYKSEYEGWYCTPCETFFNERQLLEGKLCPDCGRPVEMTQEESYFFEMSKYTDRWLKYIEDHPNFIQPQSRRNEMVNFVKQGLEDLCISRTTFDWGIPVPINEKHVIYVWFDALINYISSLGYDTDDDSLYQKFWPADIHLVGKDIIRFHTVIWPIMLMAADIPLPKKVIGHGWILLADDKMSKSKGNVIYPLDLVNKYGLNSIRYFLLREMAPGHDLTYSEEGLITRLNNDLANDYGNLLSRTTAMINKFQGGKILPPEEDTKFDEQLIAKANSILPEVEKYYDDLDFYHGLATVWELIDQANKYIDNAEPWTLNKNQEKAKLQTVLYNLAEVIRQVTIMITPVMPDLPIKVWEQLGIVENKDIHTWDSLVWGQLPHELTINRGEPLFPRIDTDALKAKKANKEAQKQLKTDQAKKQATAKKDTKEQISIDDFAKLDLRVAQVLKCEKVADADKLLCLEVAIADEKRTIVAGLAEHYAPEDLIGKKVIVVANLKPAKLRGIESQGMILAASDTDNLEIVEIEKIASGGKVK